MEIRRELIHYLQLQDSQIERSLLLEVLRSAPVAIAVLRGPEFVCEVINPAFQALAPGKQLLGRRFDDAWEEVAELMLPILRNVTDTGIPYQAIDNRFEIRRSPESPLEEVFATFSLTPLTDSAGQRDRILILATETTSAVRQRQELERSAAQSEAIIASLGEGLLIADPAGRILTINPAGVRFLRFPDESHVLRSVGEFPEFHLATPEGEQIPVERWPLSRVQHGETISGLEVQVTRLDTGERWWGTYNGTPVRNETGEIVLAVLTFQDITERKQAEEALRESEAHFRSIAECIPHIVWMATPAGAVNYMNSRGRAYLRGGTDWLKPEHLHRDDAVRTLEAWAKSVATGEPCELEIRTRFANGDYRWSLVRAEAEKSSGGEVLRWFGTITDIEDRKRAEADLHYQYSLTDAIAQHAADALYLLDNHGRVTFLNQAAEEMFGYTRAEIEGKFLHSVIHYKHSDGTPYPLSECALRGVYTQGLTVIGHEDVFFRKDGTALDVSCSNAPVFRDGKVMAAVLVVHDISQKKRAEEHLRQTQKLESIGVLAGGVAHDFNNLLTGILGSASLMQYDVPPNMRGHLDTVVRSAEKAADLTRQLLAYAGKGRYFVQPLNLSDVVQSVAGLLRLSIPKTVNLRLELQPDLPLISADEGQVQQAAINLITNSSEAIGDRTNGEIRVSTHVGDIKEEFVDDLGQRVSAGRYVAIEVTDNGEGMDEATKIKIFDPFFTTKFMGRGLGLAAVSGIMRGQKGALTIRTSPGNGTSFRLLFPAGLH